MGLPTRCVGFGVENRQQGKEVVGPETVIEDLQTEGVIIAESKRLRIETESASCIDVGSIVDHFLKI